MEYLRRLFRYLYYRFIRLQASSENLARGMALGLFISTSPTMGFQTVIALVLAAIFRCNKITAVVAAQVTNAVTGPFIYAGTYYIGAKILGTPFNSELFTDFSWDKFWELGGDVFNALWVGGFIAGIPLAIVGYFFVIGIDTKAHLKIVRAKMQMERLRRKNKPAVEKID